MRRGNKLLPEVHCETSSNLDVHHVVPRARGGDHDASNLVVLCSGHHRLLHDGTLSVTGDANARLVFLRDGKPLGDSRETDLAPPARAAPRTNQPRAPTASVEPVAGVSTYADVECRTLAKAALQQLGFKASVAKQAVSIAQTRVPRSADLQTLIRESLRHCD